jgi:chaperone required for assembly of F1-ATPase
MSIPMSSSWKGVTRFYTSVAVGESPCGGYQVLIDGRALRTNAAAELVLPSRILAAAIAAEFAMQRDRVLPATQPIYNLASTTIDTYASEDAAGAADYEALLRATRLAAFDRISGDAVLASGRALEANVPSHASLDSGRGGGTMSSDSTAGTAKLRDLMLDTLETDTVCFRVEEGSDPADRQLRKRQNK